MTQSLTCTEPVSEGKSLCAGCACPDPYAGALRNPPGCYQMIFTASWILRLSAEVEEILPTVLGVEMFAAG